VDQRYTTVKIDSAIHSNLGPVAAGALARTLPPPLLRWMARLVSRRYARHSQGPVCVSIRHNQATVRGLPPDHPAVDGAVVEVLVNTALGLVDLYSAVSRGRRGVTAACHLDGESRRRVEELLNEGRGLILVGPHMVGFELLILRFGLLGFDALALSDPRPSGSNRSENQLRRQFGMPVTPISRAAVADADACLERNGLILTGIDVPTPHGERLPFFGRTARMPNLHAELSIRHGSPVYLVVPRREGDGRYSGKGEEMFQRDAGEATPERVRELTLAVLAATEKHVAIRPGHWRMVRPVWHGQAL